MPTLQVIADKVEGTTALTRCPSPLIIEKTREAVRDFFRRTRVWTEETPAIALAKGTRDYVLTFDTNDALLDVETITGLQVDISGNLMTVAAKCYGFTPARTLRFDTATTMNAYATKSAYATCAVKPVVGFGVAETIPDERIDDYLHGIIHGAASLLMTMPGRSWSDPGTAQQYGRIYNEAVGQAIYNRNTGHGVRAMSTTARG